MCLLCQHMGGRGRWISVIAKQIRGQPGIHCEVLLQNKQTKKKAEINIQLCEEIVALRNLIRRTAKWVR